VSAWTSVLDEVFGVFDASTASALFAVEAVERQQQQRWFAEGLPASQTLDLDALCAAVAEEQRRIDRVDSLDALARDENDDADLVQRIIQTEASCESSAEHAIEDARAVVAENLLFESKLGASAKWYASIGRSSAATRHRAAIVGVDLVSTTHRAVATRNPGVGLLRPGDPLVETIREQLDWDDDTQTFAVWAQGAEGSQFLAVRTELIVHADPTPALRLWRGLEEQRSSSKAQRTEADAPLALAAIQRRVDAFLPPKLVVTWFSGDGVAIEDPQGIARLETAIWDANSVERWGIDAVVAAGAPAGLATSARLLADLRTVAPAHALARAAQDVPPLVAAAEAEKAWSARTRLLRMRAERSGDAVAKREASAEEAVHAALAQAIRSPIARWSGAGVLVVESA